MDKNSAKIQESKTKIKTECYKNNIFGLAGINDDIFGLFSLLALEEDIDEPIVSTTINTILTDQQIDGSFTWAGWPGADITGVAINALKYAQTKGAEINNEIFSKAKNYLKSQQLTDGGWGNSAADALTTGWAVMGINALDEGQDEWFSASKKNPWHPLVSLINTAGYYESAWAPNTIDWFATKHAVPALLGKSWPIILPARQEETNIANNNTGGGTYLEQIVIIPTTTLEVVTTTLDITTTTPEVATTTLDITTASTTQTTSTANSYQISNNKNELLITNYELQKPKTPPTPPLKWGNTTTPTIQQFGNVTISSAPTSTIPTNPTKTMFGISLTAASGLGLYLAWRLIQTIV